jgi:hypothetical protein
MPPFSKTDSLKMILLETLMLVSSLYSRVPLERMAQQIYFVRLQQDS